MNLILPLLLIFTALVPMKATCDELFLETGAAAGRFIGLREDYVDADLFYVMDPVCNWAPLFDAHVYYLEKDTWAGSFGAGVRYQDCDCDRVWGANLFYDFREFKFEECCSCVCEKTKHRYFHRVGIGLESLGPCVDYRANVYLPIGKTRQLGDQCLIDNISGRFQATFSKFEYMPTGFDAEAGFNLGCCHDFALYGALGGYYFHHDKLKDMYGPMARFDLTWFEWLSLEGRYSYDQVNHSAFQGRIALTVPLSDFWNCCSEACDCVNLFIQPFQRNGLIFTDRKCCWKYNW
jgi:hypothetical protein